MNIFEIFLLGIVQGFTEFLPISSSGHLTILQNLLGFTEPKLLLDVVLHFGTLFSICFYFRNELKQIFVEVSAFLKSVASGGMGFKKVSDYPYAALALMVVVGTLPTVLIGGLFRPLVEKLFGSVVTVGFALLTTGMVLMISRYTTGGRIRKEGLFFAAAIGVGVAQGLALIPGVSRSGTTIVCGMMFGLDRNLAARFSFLLSIPAIIGGMTLELSSLPLSGLPIFHLTTGFITAGGIGLLSLKTLMGVVKQGRLYYFSPYCWAIGLLVIFVGLSANG